MHASRRPTFATTVRVIDRVHDNAAHRWSNTAPAIRPGFSNGAKTMLFVPDLTNGRPALDVYAANFTRAQANLCVDPLAS
jgi:hypothetical protein